MPARPPRRPPAAPPSARRRPPAPATPRSGGRVRRSAADARAAILDAAERQLIAGGPDALRIQQVAAEVGVAHPTVLHHFGSREALVEAVVGRAMAVLQADVLHAIRDTPPTSGADGPEVHALLERVSAAFVDGGHGRALAWLALSGRAAPSDETGMRAAAEVAHTLRRKRRGPATPRFEDTLFTLVLAFYALLGQSIAGPLIAQGSGYGDVRRFDARFRGWLARLIRAHLEGHAAEPADPAD